MFKPQVRRKTKKGRDFAQIKTGCHSVQFFLGEFGAHRFYLGKTGTAIAMIFTLGGLGIWALVDFIMAVVGVMKDKEGRPIKNW